MSIRPGKSFIVPQSVLKSFSYYRNVEKVFCVVSFVWFKRVVVLRTNRRRGRRRTMAQVSKQNNSFSGWRWGICFFIAVASDVLRRWMNKKRTNCDQKQRMQPTWWRPGGGNKQLTDYKCGRIVITFGGNLISSSSCPSSWRWASSVAVLFSISFPTTYYVHCFA